MDERGRCTWPGKFSDERSIRELRLDTADDATWSREYLLKMISRFDQVVHDDWIHRYVGPIPKKENLRIATGIDLAISQKESADYTAMITAVVLGYGRDIQIWILPEIVNVRFNFPQTIERIRMLCLKFQHYENHHLYIEDVGYQRALVEHLGTLEIAAEAVPTFGMDKRSRLALTTELLRNGQILFPEKGAEELIRQLIGFGVEKHDDLADAFSLLVRKLMEEKEPFIPSVVTIG